MNWVCAYIIIGLIFACVLRDDKDRMLISHPGWTIAFLFVYPFVIWYLAFRVKNFKWKGKIIWERKR